MHTGVEWCRVGGLGLERAQRLRALSAPWHHTPAWQVTVTCKLQLQGIWCPLLASVGSYIHMVYIHTIRHTHTHKILEREEEREGGREREKERGERKKKERSTRFETT